MPTEENEGRASDGRTTEAREDDDSTSTLGAVLDGIGLVVDVARAVFSVS